MPFSRVVLDDFSGIEVFSSVKLPTDIAKPARLQALGALIGANPESSRCFRACADFGLAVLHRPVSTR